MKRRLCAAVLAAFILSVPAAAVASETRVSIRISIGGTLIIGGGILFWSIGAASRTAARNDRPADSTVAVPFRDGVFSAKKSAPDFPAGTRISDEPNDLWIAVPVTVFQW